MSTNTFASYFSIRRVKTRSKMFRSALSSAYQILQMFHRVITIVGVLVISKIDHKFSSFPLIVRFGSGRFYSTSSNLFISNKSFWKYE